MPIIGLVADVDWRLAFAIPFTAAATALVASDTSRRPHLRPRRHQTEGGSGTSIWRRPDVVGWAMGGLMAFTAWSAHWSTSAPADRDVRAGHAHDRPAAEAAAAAAYFPASFVTQRLVARRARAVLVTLGLTAAAGTAALGTLTPGALFTTVLFALIVAAVGGRTLAASTFGLQSAPDDRVAMSATRAAVTQLGYFSGAALGGAALAAGGYSALTTVLALAFVLAVIPYIALLMAASRRRPRFRRRRRMA